MREILKLKLTEAPYSAVSTFVMTQVDPEAFQISTSNSRKIKPQQKKLAQNTIRQLFQFINSNMVHIDFAISSINAEEYLKMKLEYKQYPIFVL